MKSSIQLAVILVCSAVAFAFPRPQAHKPFSVDSSQSKLEIQVGRDGFFKSLGHDHLISAKNLSGEVTYDPQKLESSKVIFTVETKSLTVMDPGESEKDRAEVQSTMLGEKVLDASKFPEIRFASESIQNVHTSGQSTDFTLAGTLSLHGVDKKISFPLHLAADSGKLRATGDVSLLQTDFGITPIKVGGGAVKVKDKLTLHFEIVAIPR